MALGRQRASRVRNAPRQNGQQAGPTTTQLQQNLLPPNRRIQVRSRGSLISGRGNERGNAMKGVTPRKRHPVAYYSTTFSPTEQNYDTHDLEFLGVLKSIEHWRPYLIWTKEP